MSGSASTGSQSITQTMLASNSTLRPDGEGDIVFHFPDKVKIFLSWGDLEKATKTFGTVEKHADHGLNRVKKAGNVKNFELISHDSLRISSHEGPYNREVRGDRRGIPKR